MLPFSVPEAIPSSQCRQTRCYLLVAGGSKAPFALSDPILASFQGLICAQAWLSHSSLALGTAQTNAAQCQEHADLSPCHVLGPEHCYHPTRQAGSIKSHQRGAMTLTPELKP